MDRKELAALALEACCSEKTMAHCGGVDGRPFWNVESTQFMYAPAFHFTGIPGCGEYLYEAIDENGQTASFVADNPCAPLCPIWRDLSEGAVTLKVFALYKEKGTRYEIGLRTFFKLASFPEETPKANYSYREAALHGYKYMLSQKTVRHWLDHGTPDPSYDLNIYPSKMISALIGAMLSYAEICPECERDAVQIACNAADYLISITPDESAPMQFIPPTYSIAYCDAPEKFKDNANWKNAEPRMETVMMIYPAGVGSAYLKLHEKTKNPKYFDAALRIGEFYRDRVEENGSWRLLWSCESGKPVSKNHIYPLGGVVPFLMHLYSQTGDANWKTLADNAVRYVTEDVLKTYNWEAQFEDSALSCHYSNLSHYGACALINYFARYYAEDEQRMAEAEDMMRFVEDQFVIWKRPAPWNRTHLDTSVWHTPAALEQYNWHVPIDASTSSVLTSFLALYKAGRGELYLAKAKALADQIVVMQEESGRIPTHWMEEPYYTEHFWLNCMINSLNALVTISEYDD